MELLSVQEQIVATELYIKTNMITTVQCGYQKLTVFLTQSFSRVFIPWVCLKARRVLPSSLT
jgi:hypothetical protein